MTPQTTSKPKATVTPKATVNPVRLAGHPVHSALVHLPMGLFIAAAIWDALAFFSALPIWWQLSYYSLGLGLVGAVPAALVGAIDFVALPADHEGEKAGLYHLSAMLSSLTLYLLSFLIRGDATPLSGSTELGAIATSWSACLILLIGGRFGGDLVYRHRVGIDPGSNSVG